MLAKIVLSVEMSCTEHARVCEGYTLRAVAVRDGRALDRGEIDCGLNAPNGDASQLQQDDQTSGAQTDDALHARNRCESVARQKSIETTGKSRKFRNAARSYVTNSTRRRRVWRDRVRPSPAPHIMS